MPDAPEDSGIPHLAARLNRLFDTIPQPKSESGPVGKLYSNAAAAAALLADHAVSVTPIYLSQLRKGTRRNPSAKLLAGIANLFGVPITYFFDDDTASRIDDQLDVLRAARDQRVKRIMLRTTDLSDQGIEGLDGILTQIRRYEGLSDDQDHHPNDESDD